MGKASFFNKSNPKAESKEKDTSETAEEKSQVKPGKGDSLSKDNASTQEQWFFRRALWLILGIVVLSLFAFATGFFFTLRGAERTVIPHVEGMELVDAMIALQEKGLNGRVQVKYTQNIDDKGQVIGQTPASGQHVRVGRRVTLTVSRGSVVETVGDYGGMTLEEVTLELQTIFASFQAMIQVGDVIYQYSDKPEGTIIGQEPAAGTAVSELTSLTLVISRGLEDGQYRVDNYTAMNYKEVMEQLSEQNVPFLFSIDEDAPVQRESVIFRQVPAIGELADFNSPLQFFINPLSERALNNAGDDMIFALFEYQLPVYMVPVSMRLEVTRGTLDPVILMETVHPGGPIAIPYLEEKGSTLSLYVNDKEVIRHYVE